MQRVRWAILGTGRMATAMAGEIAAMRDPDITLVAVGSRSISGAQSFAGRHGIARAHVGAEGLAADPEIDAVYVATPHSSHCEDMITCLRGNKAVLCEKPFTLSAREAQRVIALARERRIFAMEAMWTRFLPALVALRELLDSGAIGRPQLLVAGGAFVPAVTPDYYLLNRDLGGGALLDAGVYLVSLASMVLGPPAAVHAAGRLGHAGVDEQDAILLEQPGGAHALLYVSLCARRAPDLEILGSAGRVRLDAPVFRPSGFVITAADGTESRHDYPIAGSGYRYEVQACSAAIRSGLTESPVMPLDETLSILRTMDAVRARLGLRYPGE